MPKWNLKFAVLSLAVPALGASFCFSAGFESLYIRPLSTLPLADIDVPMPAVSGEVAPAYPAAVRPDIGWVGERFTARVRSGVDGDSLLVERGGKLINIRLAEVDTPEYDQPYGREAKLFTRGLATGKTVSVEVRAIDAYKRRVAVVTLPGGAILNRELLKAGLAWWYRYFSDDETFGEIEREARKAKRGLWADPNPVPPWVHRRNRQSRDLTPIDPAEL